MKIDTSTTAGKIAVMQAYEDGKVIEFKHNKSSSWDCLDNDWVPSWDWSEIKYRIKHQTVKRAARDSISHNATHCEYFDGYIAGAVFGAKWQKEQDVDNCIKSEQENDQYERDCNE